MNVKTCVHDNMETHRQDLYERPKFIVWIWNTHVSVNFWTGTLMAVIVYCNLVQVANTLTHTNYQGKIWWMFLKVVDLWRQSCIVVCMHDCVCAMCFCVFVFVSRVTREDEWECMLSSESNSPEKERAESGPVMCFQTDTHARTHTRTRTPGHRQTDGRIIEGQCQKKKKHNLIDQRQTGA